MLCSYAFLLIISIFSFSPLFFPGIDFEQDLKENQVPLIYVFAYAIPSSDP